MKKLIIILCLFVSVTNHAQAQTKEETITWLKEKLMKYMYHYANVKGSIDVNLSECHINITYRWDSKDRWYAIPTNEVIIDGAGFHMKIAGIKDGEGSKVGFTYGTENIEIKKGEENLFERLQKAIDHLATFCPKTKETF
ncbi:MAG: hypothetical protein H7320_03185 [Ferruginibacter sp.]|nr:hypothetical protein [Ferruginibacter sp.]